MQMIVIGSSNCVDGDWRMHTRVKPGGIVSKMKSLGLSREHAWATDDWKSSQVALIKKTSDNHTSITSS